MSMENDLLRPTWIVENYNVLRDNVRQLKALVGNDVRLICVVKGNAYGCGLKQTVRVLDREDIYGFGTGNIYEALEIRKQSSRPILLFGNTLPSAIPEILAYEITPSVSDWEWVLRYSQHARKESPVFVKVDVGANRLGVSYPEAVEFVEKVSKLPNIRIDGIHTHIGWALAETGTRRLADIVRQLEERGIRIPIKLAANSELTARLPSAWFNAVNPGKLVYGIRPCELDSLDVHHVFRSLKSRIILVKKPVGDALKGVTRLGVIPIGFADGLPSAYKENAYVLIHGKRAPIIQIHAEHTRIDLSDIPEAEVSEEVVVIGTSGAERIEAGDVAHRCGMTESELLRNLAHCIPAVCIEGGRFFMINPISADRSCFAGEG